VIYRKAGLADATWSIHGGMVMKPTKQETNSHLTAAFLEVVENQLREDNPPETRETLSRLMAEGYSREDAVLLIAQAVCVEAYTILKTKKEFNHDRYVRNLSALPQEPDE
jgi:hypothetical protein